MLELIALLTALLVTTTEDLDRTKCPGG